MSFKKYYGELLRHLDLTAPTAEEAQRDFRQAMLLTNWAQIAA